MAELGGGTRLAQEALQIVGSGQQAGVRDSQGDNAV